MARGPSTSHCSTESYLKSLQDAGPASRGTSDRRSLSSSSRSPMEDAFRHRGPPLPALPLALHGDDVTPAAAPAALHGAVSPVGNISKNSSARHGTDTQTPGIIY
ncbi:hypothetical protein CgunFtcFv8_027483 [Champsocephalus gunnari]|uniref:Uncharacterized protein n=1 Tax=Champsocephalus gunnari TaxID=52237 RepID=A0AAN8DZ97_CHAGU|nr:hypothetical protein CgunFtcFv8_027483 [Champsocephalus gunnari]